jgi:hypothetical protein
MLGNPTNLIDGQELTFLFKQPVAGGCALTFDTKYRFIGSDNISVTPSTRSLITCSYDAGDDILDCMVWGSGGAAQVNTLLAKTLAYWNLNEASGDRLDTLFGVALVDGSSVVTSATGVSNNAAVFHDTGGLVATTPSSFDVASNPLSFSFAVKIASLSSGYFTLLVTSQWYLVVDGDGTINLTAGTVPSGAVGGTSTHSFPEGSWVSIIGQFDKANDIIALKINNNAVETFYGIGAETLNAFDGSLVVGSSGNNLFIDELGFYNARLTLSEMALIYNSGSFTTYPFS